MNKYLNLDSLITKDIVTKFPVVDIRSMSYGNSVNNDWTYAINRAIAILNQTGGTILFPPGIYRITAKIELSDLSGICFIGCGSPTVDTSADSFGDLNVTDITGSGIYFDPVTETRLINPTTLTASTWYKVLSGSLVYDGDTYLAGNTFYCGSSPLSCSGTATIALMTTGSHFELTDCKNITFKNLVLYSDYGLGSNGNECGGLYFNLSANDNNPQHLFENVLITNCNNTGLVVSTPIMNTFTNVKVSNCATDSLIHCYNGTSVEFNSCYVITGINYGFNLSNMTYSVLNSCAAETVKYGYRFSNCNAISLNGCGSEAIRTSTTAKTYGYYAESEAKITLNACYNTRKDARIYHYGTDNSISKITTINFCGMDVFSTDANRLYRILDSDNIPQKVTVTGISSGGLANLVTGMRYWVTEGAVKYPASSGTTYTAGTSTDNFTVTLSGGSTADTTTSGANSIIKRIPNPDKVSTQKSYTGIGTNTIAGLINNTRYQVIKGSVKYPSGSGTTYSYGGTVDYFTATTANGLSCDTLTTGENIIAEAESVRLTYSNILDANYLINDFGVPGFSTYQDFIDQVNSSGIIGDFTLTGGTSSTGTVSAISGIIKTSNSINAPEAFFEIKQETVFNSLTDNDVNYIYVEYNSGNPRILTTTTRSNIHLYDHIILGGFYREGTSVKILKAAVLLSNFTRNYHERLIAKQTIERMSGLLLSGKTYSGDSRYLTMSSGLAYVGMYPLTINSFDSSTTNFEHYYYKLNGNWTTITATGLIDNLQYNNLSTPGSENLATLTNNRYGVHWIYSSYEGKINVIYGSGDYNQLSLAQAEQPPVSIPNYLIKFGILIGKVIIKKSDVVFTETLSAFAITFTPSMTSNHNELSNLELSYEVSGHFIVSPDGTKWKLLVDNFGNLSTTLV